MIKYIRYHIYVLKSFIYKKIHGERYYKFVNPNGHHGLIYKEGWNDDPLQWNPDPDCEPGGIYFTDSYNILNFIGYGDHLYEITGRDENRQAYGTDKYKSHSVKLKLIGDNIADIVKFITDYKSGIIISNNFQLESLLIDIVKTSDIDTLRLLIKHLRNIRYSKCFSLYDDIYITLQSLENNSHKIKNDMYVLIKYFYEELLA